MNDVVTEKKETIPAKKQQTVAGNRDCPMSAKAFDP
jgi:hypothetical protein